MTCINCGVEVPEGNGYCPNCGATVKAADSPTPVARNTNLFVKILVVILFVVVGVPAALLGACFLIVTATAPTHINISSLVFGGCGISFLAISYGLFVLLQRTFKRK